MTIKKRIIASDAGLQNAHQQIAIKLKEYYDSREVEAIPERFLELLDTLEATEREEAACLRAGGK